MPTSQYLSVLTIILLLLAIMSGYYAYQKIFALTERLDIPVCRAEGITAMTSGYYDTGKVLGTLQFTNDTGAPCSLKGYAKVRFKDKEWNWLPVQSVKEKIPRYTRITLQPDQIGVADFTWDNWCGGNPPLPVNFIVGIPETGERLEVLLTDSAGRALETLPVCATETLSSTITVSPFTRANP
jgi:hypothetical protein